jgi:hypothetical protein
MLSHSTTEAENKIRLCVVLRLQVSRSLYCILRRVTIRDPAHMYHTQRLCSSSNKKDPFVCCYTSKSKSILYLASCYCQRLATGYNFVTPYVKTSARTSAIAAGGL